MLPINRREVCRSFFGSVRRSRVGAKCVSTLTQQRRSFDIHLSISFSPVAIRFMRGHSSGGDGRLSYP